MKYYFTLLFAMFLMACNNSKPAIKTLPKSIAVQVDFMEMEVTIDSLRLFAWNAVQAELFMTQAVTKTEKGSFCNFTIEKISNGMYFVGTSLQDMKPLLLGTEAQVVLEATNGKMSALKIKESDLNKEYDALMLVLQQKNQNFVELMSAYQRAKGKEKEQQEIKGKMAAEDKFKLNLLDSLRQKNSELARIMAFNAFQSYPNHGQANQSEGQYFAADFLKFVDVEDSVYVHLPFYYEHVKSYSSRLTQTGISNDEQRAAFDALLSKMPSTHQNHRPTLTAIMFGLMGRNDALFVDYAKQYKGQYQAVHPMIDEFLEQQFVRLKGPPKVGEIAPNLKGETPEGKPLEMHSLRGKYLLLDFWASWCGPCRQENPNVVRLYNKYKEKGFEILGISLDDNRARWQQAIEKDGLTWYHLSDLHGRGSPLSQIYGVRGIPYTVLLDKEGKIIAQNLRGGTLEAKLKELMGE